MPRAKQGAMNVASLRDFGGGWNVADAEYNLSSRFLTVADNVTIGIDNALGPRAGSYLAHDFFDGVVSEPVNVTANITTNTGGYVLLTLTGHPYNSGDHITISGINSAIDGIPAAELNATHGVIKVDANTVRIQTRTTGATGLTVSKSYTHVRDTHTLGGNIIECAFFQNYVIVMSDIGELARVHYQTGVKSKIWNIALAAATSGAPRGWGPCDHYSFDTWKQTLIVVNGRNNDKPIEIDNERPTLAPVQYLVDPATSSNTFVYPADFVLTHGNYLLLVGANNPNTPSRNTPTLVEISAAGTSGVFTGNLAPDDACQIDLGQVTTTVDPRITGVSSIRDNVFVAFYDTAMLGTLGTYSGAVHKPDFKDQLPQHGSLNHRVIKNIGNDLFMCDYAGVPAFSQSQQSGIIVPERFSQLIDPALIKHFARLSDYTRRYSIWSIFNTRDRQYMLFAPKFDEASMFNGNDNGIFCVPDLTPYSLVLVSANNHTVSAGDFVVVSGATDLVGLSASAINGTRRVVSVVDENTFIMKVGSVPGVSGVSGGGTSIEFAPVNDEYLGYIFQYNPALKIRRWTRYRGLRFVCACLAKDGTVYMCRDGRVFIWGTGERNYTADDLNEYDYIWSTATNYTVGDRVKKLTTDDTIYECVADHTSSGTFATDVEESENWQVYRGHAIEFVAESPWSDYGKRAYKKINKYIKCDTKGSAKFKISAFVDNIYRDYYTEKYYDGNTIEYDTSVVNYSFVATDAGGFGSGIQSYGLGMRTREQLNIEFPFECQLAKLRFSGTTTEPLKIVGITLLYQLGSIYR